LTSAERAAVPFRDAARFWITLGFINFGGPSGQIALMHHELVDRRGWIDEDRFLHALSFCTLLPGPEAQQLAIYVGWLLHRAKGGVLAGVAFVLPSFFLILGLSWAYAAHGSIDWVAGIFAGLSAGVVGLVAVALLRIGTRALKTVYARSLAVAAFVAIFVFGVAFPLVVLGAAVLGLAGERRRPGAMGVAAVPQDATDPHTSPSRTRTVRVVATGLAVWWLPLLAVALWRGSGDTLSQEALFFGGAAVVTFGGAYAVLAYVNQAAVTRFGWLAQADVVAGLGLAESTPGPLIMVLEFVGFLAAYRFPGDLAPTVAGIIGAAVAVWATFAPCFLWVFLGAPYVERLRGNRPVASALAGVTSAVVGVIASLAVTFAVHVLFGEVHARSPFGAAIAVPVVSSIDVFALVVAAAGFALLRWRNVNAAIVAVAAGAAGLARALLR